MKETKITCDQCQKHVPSTYVTWIEQHRPGTSYATYEGARNSFDFCDDACMLGWLEGKFR